MKEQIKQVQIGMTEYDVLDIMPKPTRITRSEKEKITTIAGGSVMESEARLYWSLPNGHVHINLTNGHVVTINHDECDEWAEVKDFPGYECNEGFIQPGHVHEIGQLITNQQGHQQIRYRQIYVESIEIIGGSVFLGLRDLKNMKLNEANTEVIEYELYDTIQYHNINLYVSVQKFGTRMKFNEEVKQHNDKLLAEQEELKRQKDEEAAAEAKEFPSIDTNEQ